MSSSCSDMLRRQLERKVRELSRQLDHAATTLNSLRFCAPLQPLIHRPFALTSLPRGFDIALITCHRIRNQERTHPPHERTNQT